MNINLKLVQTFSDPGHASSTNTTQITTNSKVENDVVKGLPLYIPCQNNHEPSDKEKLQNVGIRSAKTLVHKTENHIVLKTAKTFVVVSEVEEGDYFEQMDEDHDMTIHTRLIHHFKTSFFRKFENH